MSANVDDPGSIQVLADVSRNCLRLSFVGVVGRTELERYESELQRAIKSMARGFALLTDLTALNEMSLDAVPAIDRTMEKMKAAGVGLIVRVIPDTGKDIGMSILSLFHYPRTLKIVTTQTLDEAEKILAKS